MADQQLNDTGDLNVPTRKSPTPNETAEDERKPLADRSVRPKIKGMKKKAAFYKNVRKQRKPVLHNHFHLKNSPVVFGSATGSSIRYDVSMKLFGLKDEKEDGEETTRLHKLLHSMWKGESEMTPLTELLKQCDADLIGIGPGCVKLTLRVYSRDGLYRLWNMFTSGELEGLLKEDLPLDRVYIDEQDYKNGCRYFDENTTEVQLPVAMEAALLGLDKATLSFIHHRKDTVDLLRDIADSFTKYHRKAQLQKVSCWAAGIVFSGMIIAGFVTSSFEFDWAFLLFSVLFIVIASVSLKMAITTSRFLDLMKEKINKIKDPFIYTCSNLNKALDRVGNTYQEILPIVKVMPADVREGWKIVLNGLESTHDSVKEGMSSILAEQTTFKESSKVTFLSVLGTLEPEDILRLQDHTISHLVQSLHGVIDTIEDENILKKISEMKEKIKSSLDLPSPKQ